jgi:hypothetical protein
MANLERQKKKEEKRQQELLMSKSFGERVHSNETFFRSELDEDGEAIDKLVNFSGRTIQMDPRMQNMEIDGYLADGTPKLIPGTHQTMEADEWDESGAPVLTWRNDGSLLSAEQEAKLREERLKREEEARRKHRKHQSRRRRRDKLPELTEAEHAAEMKSSRKQREWKGSKHKHADHTHLTAKTSIKHHGMDLVDQLMIETCIRAAALQYMSEEERLKLTSVLHDSLKVMLRLSTSTLARDGAVDLGIVPSLVQLLLPWKHDSFVIRTCVSALANFTATNTNAREQCFQPDQKEAKEGAVVAKTANASGSLCVEMMQEYCEESHDTELLTAACQTLAHLTRDEKEMNARLAQSPLSVESLLTVASTQVNENVLQGAMAAIAHLTRNAEQCALLLRTDGHVPVVKVLTRTQDLNVKVGASQAMERLSLSPIMAARLVEAGGVAPLVQICKVYPEGHAPAVLETDPSGMRLKEEEVDALKAACGALRHCVYHCNAAVGDFGRLNGIFVLCNICKCVADASVLNHAGHCLQTMAKPRALPFGMKSSAGGGDDDVAGKNMWVRHFDGMTQLAGIVSLISRAHDPEVLGGACGVLKELVNDFDIRRTLVIQVPGAMKTVLEMLAVRSECERTVAEAEVVGNACSALWTLATHEKVKCTAEILQVPAGGCAVLEALAACKGCGGSTHAAIEEAETAREAARAAREAKAAREAAPSVPTTNAVVATPKDVQDEVDVLLESSDEEGAEDEASNNTKKRRPGPPVVVGPFKADMLGDEELELLALRSSAGLLKHLCEDETVKAGISENGDLHPLLFLPGWCADTMAREEALWALALLLTDETVRAQTNETERLAPLCALIEDSNTPVSVERAAATCLLHLSLDRALAGSLHDAHAIRAATACLRRTLAGSRDEVVLEGVAGTCCELAMDSSLLPSLHREGVVGLMIRLVKKSSKLPEDPKVRFNVKVLRYAAGCLCCMAKDGPTALRVSDEGGLAERKYSFKLFARYSLECTLFTRSAFYPFAHCLSIRLLPPALFFPSRSGWSS